MQEQGKGSRAWICLLVIYSDVQCYDGNSTELEWFSEVLGQRQSSMRTMKTDFRKIFINSRISRKKIKILRMGKNVIVSFKFSLN